MVKDTVCQNCQLYSLPGIVEPEGNVVNPDVVFLGGYPWYKPIQGSSFGKPRDLMRSIVTKLLCGMERQDQPTIAHCFSIQCVPSKEGTKFVTNIDMINECGRKIMAWLDKVKPKVIVALGTDALKTLGFKETIKSVRGSRKQITLSDGTNVDIIATISPGEVGLKPGMLPTMIADITKAFDIAKGRDIRRELDIKVLKNAEDIKECLRGILSLAEKQHTETGKRLALAVDTETTSLEPYNPSDRLIAVSLSWASHMGVSFPIEHVECLHTPADLADIKDLLQQVLTSEHISTIGCNFKFDLQWLKYHSGIDCTNYSYDTQLAEHCIDEDKKGEYSLKDITRDRFPYLGDYEEQLHEKLNEAQQKFDEEYKEAVDAEKARLREYALNWWINLSEDERVVKLAHWIDKKYVDFSDSKALTTVKYRKLKGETVIPKKYKDSIVKMLNAIPDYELNYELPDMKKQIDAIEHKKVTFENVDVDLMLWYAAVDALCTYLIMTRQAEDFKADSEKVLKVLNVEKQYGRSFTTKHLFDPFKNIDVPLSKVIAEMEYKGVRLDRDRCSQYITKLEETMEEYKDQMFQQVGYKFNTSSSAPDLGKYLFEELKLTPIKYTETNAPSTDADSLKQLSDLHPELEFINKLLTYRKMEKVLNTYLKNWMKISSLDGCVHSHYNLIGTSTYRLSSSSPNWQNIPAYLKESNLNIKALFIPDSEDYEIYDLDIK